MKRLINFVSLLLVFVTIFSSVVFAAETEDSRASNYFASSSTSIYRISSTSFDVEFDVTAVGMMDEIGVSEIKVQRSSDGVNWSTMQTFKKSTYPNFVIEDHFIHAGIIRYYGTPGYYYRAYVCYYAKKGTGTATMIKYTPTLLL